MTTRNVKVDSKGRVIIPNYFREALGIKFGENIVAHLDKANERVLLFPLEKKSMKLMIRFNDVPGALARAAVILARGKVDLIYTSSRSLKRGREAEWEVIADFSESDLANLKKNLGAEKAIKSFRFERLRQ
jgi:AbrB family looped-hinge helix DNA binding protein